MLVLQVINSLQARGGEIFACDLSRTLDGLGCHTSVLALSSRGGDLERRCRVSVVGMPASANRLAKLWSGACEIGRLIRECEPHERVVVQANIGDTLWAALLAKVLCGRAFTLVYRNANMMSLFLGGRWSKKLLYRLGFRAVDAIASVSDSCARDLKAMKLASSGKIYVIENGVPLGHLCAGERDKAQTSSTILHVGAFVPEKNQMGLVETFASVKAWLPQARLLMAGEGPLRSETEALVAALELEDCVEFAGSVSNIWPLLHRADVLAMPSHIEGQPGVILEAFAAGVPVVAYGVGGIPEMLAGGCGYCVAHGDQAAFAAALQTVLERPDNQELVERARRRLRERHDIKVIAREFHALYQRL